MKKNTTTIILTVVALAAGYLLGNLCGKGDSAQTKGDVNAINTYNQFLTPVEDMAFSKANAGDEEAIERTISTLQIVKSRIADFNTLSQMMQTVAEPELAAPIQEFLKANATGQTALQQAEDALQTVNDMKAGQKVNLKQASKNAEAAYQSMDNQIAVGKAFVQAVDQLLGGQDVKEHIMAASIRDLVASHCAVNASLTQNDSEIDYWGNLSGLVKSTDMAVNIQQ